MARRVLTAREQYEMLAPWHTASDMNMDRQVNKANQRAQDARRAGDHERADYLEHLRDLMVQRHSEGHQRGWSDYEPMADEEFGERTSAAPTAPWLPHRLNPNPTNPYDEEHYIPDRPRLSELPDDMQYADDQPLPHPSNEDFDSQYINTGRGWPKKMENHTLYRGVHIPLDHPAFADHPNVKGMKDILYGREGGGTEGLFAEPRTPGNLYPHPESPEGKALSKHVLDFVEDVGHNRHKYFEPFTEQNEHSRIPFTKVHDNPNPTWMGRHWTVDPDIAEDFAKQAMGDPKHYKPSGLSVMLEADWDGRGEDLGRSNVGGDWGDEAEINLVPGTNLNVTGVHIRHPHDLRNRALSHGPDNTWHNVLSEPQKRTAGRIANMPPVTLYTKPNCPQCNMTKKRLDHHGIPHQVIDVTQDPDAYDHVTNNLGYTSAPVVDAGNGNHWSGFREDRIKGLRG